MQKFNDIKQLVKYLNDYRLANKNGKSVFAEKSLALLATMYKENAKSMIKRNKKGWLVLDEDLMTYRKLTPVECERLQTIEDNRPTTRISSWLYRKLCRKINLKDLL